MPNTNSRQIFEFTFFDGQIFRAVARSEREALIKLGLGAYNPNAYSVQIIEEEKDD